VGWPVSCVGSTRPLTGSGKAILQGGGSLCACRLHPAKYMIFVCRPPRR
jgi:hypothetical protein